jgi:hypothetical protein
VVTDLYAGPSCLLIIEGQAWGVAVNEADAKLGNTSHHDWCSSAMVAPEIEEALVKTQHAAFHASDMCAFLLLPCRCWWRLPVSSTT